MIKLTSENSKVEFAIVGRVGADVTILKVTINRSLTLVPEHHQIVQCYERSLVHQFLHVKHNFVFVFRFLVELHNSPSILWSIEFKVQALASILDYNKIHLRNSPPKRCHI